MNEPYYLGKAIHFWNPAWLHSDFFMESPDTHKVFYFTFGWLSLWLSPDAMAWTGRIVTWLLLAWSWRRLSVAIVPRAWYSILTAALFACMMEYCHMAGEWVIGGVEAKGFAYVFVFLGVEALVCNRWNRALWLLGAASAFHVLVGGWAAVATGVAWIGLRICRNRNGGETDALPTIRSMMPGIVGGILLALPGLIPSLMLDWGVDPQTAHRSHQIYVFERLPHHLILSGMKPWFIWRLALLATFWLSLALFSPTTIALRRLRAFVVGAICISLAGAAIHVLLYVDRTLAADLLRYYWFRLTDVVIPMGVALEAAAMIVATQPRRLAWSKAWFAMAMLVVSINVGYQAIDRVFTDRPRSHKTADYEAWREACQWVVDSGKIPPDAIFITPRMNQTFKWYTGRSDVATWKDIPQNAASLVEWWDRIETLYATNDPPPNLRWHQALARRGEKQLRPLGEKYHANYLIAERIEPLLDFEVVFKNRTYVIYRLR